MNQGARWLIFAAGVALNIALSLLFGGFFLFLLVPLLGLPFGRSGKTCAACGAMVDSGTASAPGAAKRAEETA